MRGEKSEDIENHPKVKAVGHKLYMSPETLDHLTLGVIATCCKTLDQQCELL